MNPRALAAEFLGTFTLVFIGAGAMAADASTGGKLGLLGVALAFGLAIAVMASTLGATSGGHFNPAVTLGLLIGRQIEAGKAVGYWIAQMIGAVAGAFAIKAVGDPAALANSNYGQAITGDAITQGQAIGLEALVTFFLVMTVYGTAVDKRGPKLGALLIGLSITMGIIVSGPLTGGALNTARWFGPAVVGGGMSQWMIYVIGPLLGGALAGVVYPMLFSNKVPDAE